MSRRNAEFDDYTKDHAFKKHGGRDAITGEPLGKHTEYDHIVPIDWARRNAPDISNEQLKSSDNCRPLNRGTHKERHKNLDEEEIWFLVSWFRSIQRSLFG